MKSPEELKEIVREKYAEIVNQTKEQNESSCCGVGGCCTVDYAVFAETYQHLDGYNPEADLGLGCGIPTEFAAIRAGMTVVDLGSGAGNDCFVARAMVGDSGKVIGIDMTPAMIEKARENADKLGFNNVEFRFGEIEKIPMVANRADVVISNCVLNLVPDKAAAFREVFRILKPGGTFSVSDVVTSRELPEGLRHDAEMYAGCVSGALIREDYLNAIAAAGFADIRVVKQKVIEVPVEILEKYLDADALEAFRREGSGILSITVTGTKPEPCCTPGNGCC